GVGHTVALTRRLNVVDVAADDNLGSRRGLEIRDCAGRIHATRGGDDSEAGDHRGKQEFGYRPMSKVSRRLEVVATGARRCCTLEEKQRIVAKSYGGHA